MTRTRLLPAGLARRFALAAAGLAAGALLVISVTSSWLINRQHEDALHRLAAREVEFYATASANDLRALATRMSEVASSTILATGVVDSAGRDTYLTPFLAGIRQVNGIPVQVLFTDFEGKEISSNGTARFTAEQLAWMRHELEGGQAVAKIFPAGAGHELAAMQPLTYDRTKSPEGGLLYKIALSDLHLGQSMRLDWGPHPTSGAPDDAASIDVPVPAIFQPLHFRVTGPALDRGSMQALPAKYLPVLVIALLLFTAVVLAGAHLARVLTRDVHDLEAFSRNVVRRGFSSERAPLSGSAEVASLAGSINEMLDRLHEQNAALRDDREKLAQLANALTEADQRKDEFLATLSHELRNPLAPLRNSVHLLRQGDTTAAPALYEMMERQLNHLVRLVDDLLEVSRISRGTLVLRKERTALGEVIRNALDTSQPLISSGGHELHVSMPQEAIWVDGDAVRLAQVLSNLLNNAAIYTPPGGSLWLELTRDGDYAKLAVRDNGPGLTEDELPRLFRMFSRGTASGRGDSGLGIGLALARSIVELHGGSVEARSEGAGKGSEFCLRLPLSTAQVSSVVTRPAASQGVHGRRILVVDDNRDAAASLSMVLQTLGADSRDVHDGMAALAVLATFRADVVLLDIGMPGMDGYEVARQIRNRDPADGPVLVALTGWGTESDRQRAHDAGFQYHLTKPAEIATLEELLARIARDQALDAAPIRAGV
ncbi:MAG: ATP-binding protein [Pseudomonadota bacterium]|nr:ATP-binding protein [Pseudomonadota bacterium]